MTTTAAEAALPSVPSVYRTRASVELREFFRQRESVVFTLAFPVIMLLIFGSIVNYDIDGGLKFGQYFVPGAVTPNMVAPLS